MKILVLCTGNSCRSQMAEGWLRHYLKETAPAATVRSAGLEPHGVHPKAIQVMAEAGIDISSQRSKHLKEFLGEDFDYVITVCDNAARNCPTFPGPAARLHWPFDDPAVAGGTDEEITDVFRRVRDEIRIEVEKWLRNLPV